MESRRCRRRQRKAAAAEANDVHEPQRPLGAGGDGVLPACDRRTCWWCWMTWPCQRADSPAARREQRWPQRSEGHRAGTGDRASTRGCGWESIPRRRESRRRIMCLDDSAPTSGRRSVRPSGGRRMQRLLWMEKESSAAMNQFNAAEEEKEAQRVINRIWR